MSLTELHPQLVAALPVLAARLRAAGFDGAALRQLLGIQSPDDVGPLNAAPALERLRRERTPLAILARLFYLEAAEKVPALDRAVPRSEQETFVSAGLLARRRSTVISRLRIDCVGPLWLLADRRFREPDAKALRLPAGDMVYPPGGDSALLAQVLDPLRGERVLDLCTGSGIQGLILSPRAQTVIGVDTSRRAATLALANARLNGCDNFTARVGDLFRPVRGQRFDLIVANPPFVPAPRRGPSYHSGGPRGERVLRRIVAGLERHLTDGGRAVVISHLARRHGETLAGVVQPWLRDLCGGALVLALESGSPIDLAAAQSLFALDEGFAAYAREVRRWTAYLRRHRVSEVLLVLLAAERRGRRQLDVVEAHQRTLPLPLSRPPGEHLRDWLGG